jgi:exopolysaccharide biosynthesis protein
VYLGTSNRDFTNQKPGMQLNKAMEKYGAAAGINGGAFWDNGTGDPKVGTTPEGLVISQGQVLWNQKDTYFPDNGFAGFNQDNVLIVAKSMTRSQAIELGIRDGVAFGPVLIMDGKGNAEVYNNKSGGQNPRTCIGQRADGAVIFLCIDGRQANSLGGTYADCIDILTEYGAVNACNLDGGSSSTMFYRDVYGKYKEKGSVFMVNNYSLLASEPRRMPTFFLVAPLEEGE